MIFFKKAIIFGGFLLISLFALHTTAVAQSRQTRQTREEYIERYKAIAIDQMERYGIPASITMAQGILESDSGNSTLSRSSNNHFGIKCKKGWTGDRVYHTDDAPDECFRKYDSVEESYQDHADFLDPFKPNEGIHQVYIDGKLVLEDNEPTGVWAGKYLK